MQDSYEIVRRLTSNGLPPNERRRILNDFAIELGWRPSDQLELKDTDRFATGHLIVEHGLQNTAVISFLKEPFRFPDLQSQEKKRLLNASYNNLVDWHINVDYDGASFVYNRFSPPEFYAHRRNLQDISNLSSKHFKMLSSDHPSPNVLALDSALIRTISFWKTELSAEIPGATNAELSNLFNAIIFLRTLEDGSVAGSEEFSLQATIKRDLTLSRALALSLGAYAPSQIPVFLIDTQQLRTFDSLEPAFSREFVADFYRNRFAKYFEYDFSLMSKHALSRIYEHYVSLLRVPDSAQQSFLPAVPEEKLERSFGNVYTPEFIARFFSKYLRKQLPLSKFQKLKVADPSCGSGIFLRSILEAQMEALFEGLSTDAIRDNFKNVLGIDVDVNACNAARLSLSLLAMVNGIGIPQELSIINQDALEYFQQHPELVETFDAVIANPPFVTVESQLPAVKERLSLLLGSLQHGRTDLFLGMLKIGLELLKPAGFGAFVLPQNFLINDNSEGMRNEILERTWIHCVVDLTSLRVFDNVGVYVVLIIFQKKAAELPFAPDVLMVRCQDQVGLALEDALQDREVENSYYTIHRVPQEEVKRTRWFLHEPKAAALLRRLEEQFEAITSFAEIRQGIITGSDKIFLRDIDDVEPSERNIYLPFLPDREIEPYRVPARTRRLAFYPFEGETLIPEVDLAEKYPHTWRYLLQHKNILKARSPVRTAGLPWWRPTRPRPPGLLLRPKIVTPHLVLSPKFALDREGKYAVSHSPMVFSKIAEKNSDQLKYLLCILNSAVCFWQISKHSHLYDRGYSRLEVSTLKKIRVPNPAKTDSAKMFELLRLVDERIEVKGKRALEIEEALDALIANLYELSDAEKRTVGLTHEM